MANGFLFRDKNDRHRGYLLFCGEEICCRISDSYSGAVLCISNGHECACFHLEETSAEQRFACRVEGIACAAVLEDGKPVLATDWTMENVLRHMQPDQQERNLPETDKPVFQETPVRNKSALQAKPYLWPQRRWPPPPCISGARYVSGRWIDGSGDEIIFEGSADRGFAVACVDI